MGFKTQEDFFKQPAAQERAEGPYTGIAPPAAQQNNFMQRPQTQGGRLSQVTGDIFNDPGNNLQGELENLTKEDLKERLVVAEKVMKTLFIRNKELEEKAHAEQKITATSSQECQQCLQNQDIKAQLEKVKAELALLKPTGNIKQEDQKDAEAYKQLIEIRLQETLAEAKRHY